MGLFSRKKNSNKIGEIAVSAPVDAGPSFWDTWEPGNKPLAEKMANPNWIPEALDFFTFSKPDLDGIDFTVVARILSEGMAGGLPYSTVARNISNELNTPRDVAEFLAWCLTAFAQERDNLASYAGLVDEVEWLGGGCCSVCDENPGVKRSPGKAFPSGHIHPPACDQCSCSLIPVVDEL